MPPTTLRPPFPLGAATVVSALAAACFLLTIPLPAAAATSKPELQWSTANPAATAPPYLAYASGAYDAANSTFVVFGGIGAAGTLSAATWVWNGTGWHEYQPAGSPPARDLASMAFDPYLDQLILFGGQGADNGLLDDTWAWNGQSWIEQRPAASPAPRDGASLAYDSSGDLLLFGGTGYSVAGDAKEALPSAETTLSDTWQWEGTAKGWVEQVGHAPPARSGAVAAYDAANHTTVIFGGESSPASDSGQPAVLNDTWVWNGRAWAKATPAKSPPARFAAVADTYSPVGGLVVTGGYGASGDLSDAWYWQGSNWVPLAQTGAVISRQGAAGGYDTASGQLVVFGGTSGGSPLDLTSLASFAHVSPPASTTTTTVPPTGSTVPGRASTTTTTVRPETSTSTTPTTKGPPATSIGPGPAAPPAVVHTSAGRVRRGGQFVVSGSGFAPGAAVVVTLHSTPRVLGRVAAGSGGDFTMTVSVPSGVATGTHRIVASGPAPDGATVSASAEVDVYAPGGISARTRAFLLGLAVLIPVLTYLAMVLHSSWLARRRRRSDDPARAASPTP